MNHFDLMSNARLVEELAQLKAEQADLSEREAELKDAIAARMAVTAKGYIDGPHHRITRVSSVRTSIDGDKVREILLDPPVKQTVVVSYRVSGRVAGPKLAVAN